MHCPSSLSEPVLDLSMLPDPVVAHRMEIRRVEGQILFCVYDRENRMGISFARATHAELFVSLLEKRIVPVVAGRDLREWESALLDDIYRHHSNYKMQGLAFWLPVALVEMAVLDLLGRVSGRPLGALLGPVRRQSVEVYEAFHDRDLPASELADYIETRIRESGAKAVKFKIGGRMSRDRDCLPGRSELLPSLLRERLGERMRLYADANGSYTAPEAIRIGRVLEQAGVDFFEEPCPFDHFEETRRVADALDIPIAGGEQDGSLYRLDWMLEHRALHIVQPDLFYCGGMVRSMKIARKAHSLGALCAPHISGDGLGALYMAHFVSALDNPAPYHEYKGGMDIPGLHIPAPLARARDGALPVPAEPGLGFDIDPDWLGQSECLYQTSPA